MEFSANQSNILTYPVNMKVLARYQLCAGNPAHIHDGTSPVLARYQICAGNPAPIHHVPSRYCASTGPPVLASCTGPAQGQYWAGTGIMYRPSTKTGCKMYKTSTGPVLEDCTGPVLARCWNVDWVVTTDIRTRVHLLCFHQRISGFHLRDAEKLRSEIVEQFGVYTEN